ncbi:MAG: DUF3276 family protein [Bacteroidetes bacterium]|nr:DUF3276 family protein [Bacteroidota bacterium]
MDNDRKLDIVFSKKVNAGKRRTYFFDVRRTKGDDFYLTLTESTKRFNGEGFERHKIFLYKEDFNRFLNSLDEVVSYIKTELMPDYDYEEFDRRHEEWEARQEEEGPDGPRPTNNGSGDDAEKQEMEKPKESEKPKLPPRSKEDDDMSW